MEAVDLRSATESPDATASERFAQDAQALARAAEAAGTQSFVRHVARLLESSDGHSHPPSILMPEARDAVPFGLRRRVSVGLALCRTPSACGICLVQPRAKVIESAVAVEAEDRLSETQELAAEQAAFPEAEALPNESQLRQIRRAVAQVALDFMAEMSAIDECFARILGEQREPSAPLRS